MFLEKHSNLYYHFLDAVVIPGFFLTNLFNHQDSTPEGRCMYFSPYLDILDCTVLETRHNSKIFRPKSARVTEYRH